MLQSKILIVIRLNKIESILSKQPPCPGIIIPVFFTLAFLFSVEIIISPNCAVMFNTVENNIVVTILVKIAKF